MSTADSAWNASQEHLQSRATSPRVHAFSPCSPAVSCPFPSAPLPAARTPRLAGGGSGAYHVLGRMLYLLFSALIRSLKPHPQLPPHFRPQIQELLFAGLAVRPTVIGRRRAELHGLRLKRKSLLWRIPDAAHPGPRPAGVIADDGCPGRFRFGARPPGRLRCVALRPRQGHTRTGRRGR